MGLGKRYYAFARRSVLVAGMLLTLLVLPCCNDSPSATVGQAPIPEVTTLRVSEAAVTLSTTLPGRVAAFRIAEIRPQVGGLIQKRLFTEGANIEEGQVLYKIDPRPYQAALDSAKGALARAEANLFSIQLRSKRYKELIKEKNISQQDYDDAVSEEKQVLAEILASKANVNAALIDLGYTNVVAPISGRIGKSTVTDGAIVTAYQAQALASIQQIDSVYVDVQQSTSDVLRLRRSLDVGNLQHNETTESVVELKLEDGATYAQQGVLQFRDVTVDQTTGTVVLRMVFPNPEGVLLPGMFVRAVVHEGIRKNAILVPQQSVVRGPKGNPYAMVVDSEGKVERRRLTLDRAIGNKWLVAAGLSAGEEVIVEGLQNVRPGSTVKTVSFAESTTAPGQGGGEQAQDGR